MQCDRCGEHLIEIDRYGERLTWSASRDGGKRGEVLEYGLRLVPKKRS